MPMTNEQITKVRREMKKNKFEEKNKTLWL